MVNHGALLTATITSSKIEITYTSRTKFCCLTLRDLACILCLTGQLGFFFAFSGRQQKIFTYVVDIIIFGINLPINCAPVIG